ncbi:MAG TPA: hypothetical protein VNT54_14965, partial [Solirubrobacteraceae bacterium]|nr:hypothetical protein [Solirubrobacteraceae bacterium]
LGGASSALCATSKRIPAGETPAHAGEVTPASPPTDEKTLKKLVLGATLPGEPLYRAFGFREIERFMVNVPTRDLPRWTPHRATSDSPPAWTPALLFAQKSSVRVVAGFERRKAPREAGPSSVVLR